MPIEKVLSRKAIALKPVDRGERACDAVPLAMGMASMHAFLTGDYPNCYKVLPFKEIEKHSLIHKCGTGSGLPRRWIKKAEVAAPIGVCKFLTVGQAEAKPMYETRSRDVKAKLSESE
jgi:hypothetical protein